MNRVIKFRAWDGKQMHENVNPFRWDFVISNAWHRCEKSTGSGMLGSGGDTAEMLVPAIRYTHLMQFTGLTDKNGKEIYEGDIVREWPKKSNKVSFIVYRNKGFWVDDENYGWEGEDLWNWNKIEIIGNIHENPELLTPSLTKE